MFDLMNLCSIKNRHSSNEIRIFGSLSTRFSTIGHLLDFSLIFEKLLRPTYPSYFTYPAQKLNRTHHSQGFHPGGLQSCFKSQEKAKIIVSQFP